MNHKLALAVLLAKLCLACGVDSTTMNDSRLSLPADTADTADTDESIILVLSDFTPTISTNGWGPVETNMSNGEKAAGDGQAMRIAGNEFSAGFGANAQSNITFNLTGPCKKFGAFIGVDDETAPNSGSVKFRTYVNESILFESPIMRTGESPRAIDISFSDAVTLTLEVSDGGDGVDHDHANWAFAQIRGDQGCAIVETNEQPADDLPVDDVPAEEVVPQDVASYPIPFSPR
ncbi:MAG: NPCBM/NEW2 domain-containing protein, partial [Clostridia bacterium]|nr:NPCBM/NEW2 domain-containing protein [Deltaproteobacteria bacterium]